MSPLAAGLGVAVSAATAARSAAVGSEGSDDYDATESESLEFEDWAGF